MKRSLVAVALSLGLTTSACSALTQESPPGLQVAASIYPIAYLAQRIAGPSHVELLTTPGAEPHDFELTIKETAEVASADLVLYERGLQPAVDDAVDENATGPSVDAGRVVGLEGDDPHFWMDLGRMSVLAEAIGKRLAEVEPDRSSYFQRRTREVVSDLRRLDRDYAAAFERCRTRTIVVSHEAYGYLGRYGLAVESISGLSPEDAPTPAHLAQLQDLIRNRDITTVFTEPLGNYRVPDAVYGDLGVTVETLDPIEGQTDPDRDYLDVMRSNLAKIQEANGCTR